MKNKKILAYFANQQAVEERNKLQNKSYKPKYLQSPSTLQKCTKSLIALYFAR